MQWWYNRWYRFVQYLATHRLTQGQALVLRTRLNFVVFFFCFRSFVKRSGTSSKTCSRGPSEYSSGPRSFQRMFIINFSYVSESLKRRYTGMPVPDEQKWDMIAAVSNTASEYYLRHFPCKSSIFLLRRCPKLIFSKTIFLQRSCRVQPKGNLYLSILVWLINNEATKRIYQIS